MRFERNASDRFADRERRIAISLAGVVDPLVFEADINALLAESDSVFALITLSLDEDIFTRRVILSRSTGRVISRAVVSQRNSI